MEYSPNQMISLHKKGEVGWWLKEGSLCLFAIEKKSGIRHSITPFEAPHFIFPIQNEDPHLEIKMIVEKPSIIEEGTIPLSEKLPHLEKWITSLSSLQLNPQEKEITLILPEEGQVQIPQNAIFQAKREIHSETREKIYWLEMIEGQVGLFSYSGPATLEPQKIYPVSQNIWFHAIKDSKVNILKTEEIVRNNQLNMGLEEFHRLYLLSLWFSIQKREKEDLTRLHLREKQERENFQNTLKNFASVLTPEENTTKFSREALYQACQILGKWQKIQFSFPEKILKKNSNDWEVWLQEIAEYSEARFREIHLSSNWWKEESGPMLGFFHKKPVVLVNARHSRYSMIDPETGEKTKISREIAAHIHSKAYFFYRLFPNEFSKGKEIFKWFIAGNYKDIFPLFLYGTIGSIISLFFPLAAAILFSVVVPAIRVPLLKEVAGALLIATLSSSIFFFCRSIILTRLQGLVINEMWPAFWDRLLKLPIDFFHKISTGDLFYRMNSLEMIREQMGSLGARVFLSGIFSLFYFLVMAVYSIKLTMVAIFTLVISSLITWIAARFAIRYQRLALDLKAKLNGISVQIIESVGKLRIFGAESGAFAHWGKSFMELKKLDLATQRSQNIVFIVNSILTLFSPALLFLLSIHLSIQGELPAWVFLAFNAAFFPFLMALIDVSNTAMTISQVVPEWERVSLILKEPVEVSKEKIKPGKLSGHISIDHLFFRYHESAPFILNDLSLEIHPKEMVAIVGFSGSGKSTLIRMLLGFEKPESGAIYFDEKDFSELNVHLVRKQIGVVLQESNFISGSLFDNITCGGIYSEEEIKEALHLSGFDEELEKLPMGLNTPISGASTFSGGQKQKLLIARALVSRPQILIFDEAMSSLDNQSQDRISKNIDELGITRILIAHRLSTVRQVNRIYVLDKGAIIQSGTFEELSKKEGLFQSMLNRQQI